MSRLNGKEQHEQSRNRRQLRRERAQFRAMKRAGLSPGELMGEPHYPESYYDPESATQYLGGPPEQTEDA